RSCVRRAATKSPDFFAHHHPPAAMAEPLKIVPGRALTAQQKKDLLNRLARVEGQLRGIQKLVALADAPLDVDAVAQQMAAARKSAISSRQTPSTKKVPTVFGSFELGKRNVDTISVPTPTISTITRKAWAMSATGSGHATTAAATQAAPAVIGMPTK